MDFKFLSWENVQKNKFKWIGVFMLLYVLDVGLTLFGFGVGLGQYENNQDFFTLRHQIGYISVLVGVMFLSFSKKLNWGKLNEGVFYGCLFALFIASMWNVLFFILTKCYGLW